jgi:hypothetical protein
MVAKITVIIPTYNRPKCIEKILEDCLLPYNGSLFSFEIYDSSDNQLTKIQVDNFLKKKASTKLQYFNYTNNDISGDSKTILAVKNVLTDYFYILGDGNLVNFNALEKLLLGMAFESYSVIGFRNSTSIGYMGIDKDAKKEMIISTNNPLMYFSKYFSYLTYWGSSIISTSFFSPSFKLGLIDKYTVDKNSWWLPSCVFECLDLWRRKNQFSNCGMIYTDALKGNPYKKGHSWTVGEAYFQITFDVFNKDIMMLPPFFDSQKNQVTKTFRDDSLANKKTLALLRIKGTIKLSLVIRHRKSIKFIDGYYWFLILLSICPKFLLIILRDIYKLLHKSHNISKDSCRFS